MNDLAETLALLTPEDLFPVWSCVDLMEELGALPADEAMRWKLGVFGLMLLWELEPDDLVQFSATPTVLDLPQRWPDNFLR